MARYPRLAALLLATAFVSTLRATVPDAAEEPIKQFLAQDDAQRPYRAIRRLEAENGGRKGWLEASTEYSRELGFRYEMTGAATHYQEICPACRRALFGLAQGALWTEVT